MMGPLASLKGIERPQITAGRGVIAILR